MAPTIRAVRRPRRGRSIALLIGLSILLVFAVAYAVGRLTDDGDAATPPIEYSAMLDDLRTDKVATLTIKPRAFQAVATRTEEAIDAGAQPEVATELPGQFGIEQVTKAAESAKVPTTVDLSGDLLSQPTTLSDILVALLPTLLLFLLIGYLIVRLAPPRSNSEPVASSPGGATFADVAGCEEAIEELADVEAFLEDPERFTTLGAKIPKGVLLHGPPGTGKTLLARALANEAHASFFSASGSDFVEMYAGLGSARVRKLFRSAKKHAPAIIFVDELDALGRRRTDSGDGGARESDNTLNQLLVEMDGFEVAKTPIIVIGATNRPDILDPALLRPGRFDRSIPLDPPDRAGRLRVLETHARGKPLEDDISLETLAGQTAGMSGADLANLLNEAALLAARRRGDAVSRHDIEQAMLRVVAGPAREQRRFSERERRVIAVHEAGHALVGELLDENEEVTKISIIPRGRSGGQTLSASQEEAQLPDEAIIRNRLAMLLAGRAAEIVVIGTPTTGAGNDLERASDLTYQMLVHYGFSHELGLATLSHDRPLSPERAARIEQECARVLEEEQERARQLILNHREALERVVAALLEHETLSREQFLELLGHLDEMPAG